MKRNLLLSGVLAFMFTSLALGAFSDNPPGFRNTGVISNSLKRENGKVPKTAIQKYIPKHCDAIMGEPIKFSEQGDTHSEERLVKKVETVPNGKGIEIYEYNEHGLLSHSYQESFEDKYGKETYDGSDLSTGRHEIYEYPSYFAPGLYTSKYKYSLINGGVSGKVNCERREYHPNGKVAVQRTWKSTYGNDSYEKDSIVSDLYHINEDGYILSYSYRSSLYSPALVYTYHYFPLGDFWFRARHGRVSNQKVYEDCRVTVKENSYVLETYVSPETQNPDTKVYEYGTPVLKKYEEYFYSPRGDQCGYLEKNYDENDGSLISAVGERADWEFTSEKLKIVFYRYASEIKDWVLYHATEYSANYEDPWVYKQGEFRWIKRYTSDGNALKLDSERRYEWKNKDIVKCEINYVANEGIETYYYCVVDNDFEDAYYDETTGHYVTQETRDEWWNGTENVAEENKVYTYHQPDGEVVGRFMRIRKDFAPTTWYKADESGKWGKCTGPLTIYKGQDRSEIAFDDEGRLLTVTNYENDKWAWKEEYEYTPVGFRVIRYAASGSVSGNVVKEYSAEIVQTGDIISETNYTYDPNGAVLYASKKDFNVETEVWLYYELKNGAFVKSHYAINWAEIKHPDGKIEVIQRDVDDNGNVILKYREITKQVGPLLNTGSAASPKWEYTYDYLEKYEYHPNLKAWYGVERCEKEFIPIPPKPYLYHTHYNYQGITDVSKRYPKWGDEVTSSDYNYTWWTWNRDSNDWDLENKSTMNYKVEGQKWSVEAESYSPGYRTQTIQQTFSANSAGYLGEETRYEKITGYYDSSSTGTKITDSRTVYDVDDKGRAVRAETTRTTTTKPDNQDEKVTNYSQILEMTYAPVRVLGATVDEITGTMNNFNLSGRMLNAGDEPVSVFTLQGVKVSELMPAQSFELPSEGIYILKTASGSVKIAVK